MDWYLYAFDVSDIARFMRRIFFTGDKGFDVSPDMARDIFFTILTFGFGWLFSIRATRASKRARMIDELIAAQREMARRAYPDDYDGIWRRNDTREPWMLDPFVTRLRFLIANIAEEKVLKRGPQTAMDVYVEKVVDFIGFWSKTKNRGDGYDYRFLVMHDAFIDAVKKLGLREFSKIRGIVPKRFAMKVRSHVIIGLPPPPPPEADDSETRQEPPKAAE